MIEINGVAIKTPQKCTVGIDDVAAKSERNALGETLIDRVAVKRRLDMEWGPLSNSECSAILSAVSGVFFSVEYPDPQTGLDNVIVCHVRGRTSPMLKYSGSAPYWDGLKLSLEER